MITGQNMSILGGGCFWIKQCNNKKKTLSCYSMTQFFLLSVKFLVVPVALLMHNYYYYYYYYYYYDYYYYSALMTFSVWKTPRL